MEKLLLLSYVIGLIALPIFAARARDPRRGMGRTLLWVVLLNMGYLFAVMFIYFHGVKGGRAEAFLGEEVAKRGGAEKHWSAP